MGRRITLTDTCRWAEVQLSQEDVPAVEQAALFRMIMHINNNMWKPSKIGINQFAAKLNVDKRTAKKLLDTLVRRGWLINTNNGYILNVDNEDDPNTENESDDTNGTNDNERRADSEGRKSRILELVNSAI